MKRASLLPDLALPFGALGGVLGWVFAGALQNPILQAARDLNRGVAAAVGGAAAWLLGGYLTRRAEASPDAEPGGARLVLTLALGLAAGGAMAGALVGAVAGKTRHEVVLGLLAGLLALPLCAIVLSAARRAERARLGSLVAEVDRREVWASLLVAAAVGCLAGLLAGPAWATLDRPGPWVEVAVSLVAVALLLVLHLRDLRARRALAVEGRDLGECRHAEAPHGELPVFDLGLGDELQSRYAAGASAYRDHEREVAVVHGSLDEAARALRWAAWRGRAFLGIGLLCALAQAAALGPFFRLDYARVLCDRHDYDGCGGFGRVLAARDPGDPAAGAYFARGCDPHDPRHCAALVAWFEGNPLLEKHREAVSALREVCSLGHGPACATASGVASRAGDEKLAVMLRKRACSHGHQASCDRGPGAAGGARR